MEATAEANLAKRNPENSLKTEEIEVSPLSGRRIIELTELGKKFKLFPLSGCYFITR